MPDVKLLLLRAGFRPIAFNPFYAHISGCVKAGLLLSQAMYWQENVGADQWFYKTQQDWQLETCLTRAEQEGARKTLGALGLLEMKVAGMPGKVHYRVNLLALADRLSKFQPAENQQPSMLKTSKPYKEAETTTETTVEKNQHASLFEIPDWMPAEAWASFIEMRRKMRNAPLTDRAIKMLFNELCRLREAGEDPERVLNTATMKGWRGLFPVREKGANGKQTSQERLAQELSFIR